MKKDFIIEYTITGKGNTHFTDSGDEDFLTVMVVDHKAGKLHIEKVTYQTEDEKEITIYDGKA